VRGICVFNMYRKVRVNFLELESYPLDDLSLVTYSVALCPTCISYWIYFDNTNLFRIEAEITHDK